MQIQKMSFSNIKGKLSRMEMKNINGGIKVYTMCACMINGTATTFNCSLGTPMSTCASNNGCGSTFMCAV